MKTKNAFNKIIVLVVIAVIISGGGIVYWRWGKNWFVKEKSPKVWVEEFKTPIDPNTEPEKHKAVYEKVQKMVSFPVKYPTQLPGGYKLAEVKSIGSGSYFDYKNEDKNIQLFEGVGDIGHVNEIELLKINFDYQSVLWEEGENLGITLYPQNNSLHTYTIIGNKHELKEDLIEIAKFLVNL